MTNAQLETFKLYGVFCVTLIYGNSIYSYTRPYPNAYI